MSKTINGRGPNGRALNQDGSERKARVTLTAAQRVAKALEQVKNAAKGIGREQIANVPSLAGFCSGISTVRKYAREMVAFGTEDKRAAKREWLEAQLATIEDKGVISEDTLPEMQAALDRLDNFESDVGEKYLKFSNDNGRDPTSEESEAIVRECASEDVIAFVEDKSKPENDPYGDYRRGVDSDGEDNDSL